MLNILRPLQAALEDLVALLVAGTGATALWALSRLAKTRGDLDHALGVFPWAERLRKADGSYRMSSTNRISYMRWGQAHMLLGLASLRRALEAL